MEKQKWNTWRILLPVFLGIVVLVVLMARLDTIKRETPVQPSPTTTVILPQPLSAEESLDLALSALSVDRMYATLEDLVSIEEHSGWRGSATLGEAQALDYLQTHLEEFTYLKSTGMTIEREAFNVFMATEDHTSSVFLMIDGFEVEVPADAVRGNRDDPSLTIRMDSDGRLMDEKNDPLDVQGGITLIPDQEQLDQLTGSGQQSRICLVEYSLVNSVNQMAQKNIASLVALDPGAIILISRFSNDPIQHQSNYLGDGGGMFQRTAYEKTIPLLFIELENLAALGISDWDEMEKISNARVTWDVDVTNPAKSGNLIVHIPGKHSDKAMLISAHIDSANTPGALDDGSGSAVLMEILNIFEQTQLQPELDLYLAWFGSEEIGLYGSTYFTTTHSDLINRLQANLQIDCLTRPLDGFSSVLTLMASHTPVNLESDPWVQYLLVQGQKMEIPLFVTYAPFASDNGTLSAFRVPNINLINESSDMNEHPGGIWAAGHIHDPYDTLALVKDMEEMYLDMARLGIAAAFMPYDRVNFITRQNLKEVVFLANHTEDPHLTPTGFVGLSQILMESGYRISVIPFSAELKNEAVDQAEMVVVLPAYDFSVSDPPWIGDDAAWTQEEAKIIDQYVQNGGKVLVVNCGSRLKFANRVMEPNEDWNELNTLTEQWSVTFTGISGEDLRLSPKDSELLDGVNTIDVSSLTTVDFSVSQGSILIGTQDRAYLAEIEVGEGKVLILADMTLLGDRETGLGYYRFLVNLADW